MRRRWITWSPRDRARAGRPVPSRLPLSRAADPGGAHPQRNGVCVRGTDRSRAARRWARLGGRPAGSGRPSTESHGVVRCRQLPVSSLRVPGVCDAVLAQRRGRAYVLRASVRRLRDGGSMLPPHVFCSLLRRPGRRARRQRVRVHSVRVGMQADRVVWRHRLEGMVRRRRWNRGRRLGRRHTIDGGSVGVRLDEHVVDVDERGRRNQWHTVVPPGGSPRSTGALPGGGQGSSVAPSDPMQRGRPQAHHPERRCPRRPAAGGRASYATVLAPVEPTATSRRRARSRPELLSWVARARSRSWPCS